MPDHADPIKKLEALLQADWASIRKAQRDTVEKRAELEGIFRKRQSSDTSLVVFGSVARQEVTSSSDLDWILLVDGQSFPEHKDQELGVRAALEANGFPQPGRSGVFGGMVSSHDLVHNIGGEDDLNSNTTRRVLMLLESLPIGNREAFDRVRRQVLKRYIEDDRGIRYGSGDVRIPRFLLNDLTRYWRTVTVDFVYKQRAENDKKWALRNAKLRMSRKLVFAAGLLRCFNCHLDGAALDAREELKVADGGFSALISYVEDQLSKSPLELLAQSCLDRHVKQDTARLIFNNYDRFLGILDDPEKRSELERATNHEDLRNSSAWKEVRDVSRPFHDGLVALFLNDDEDLKDLTMEYGVF